MSRLLVAQRALTAPGWVKDLLWRRAQAIPSLDLRFADNKSLADAVTGASLVTFARDSSGTYVDSAGVLQTAATDEPRFDHNPSTGESLGLLVEEQRVNTILQSNQFNTTWAPGTGNPTISLVTQTAPDGNVQSWKLVEGTTSGSQSLIQTNVSSSTGVSAYSVYVKAAERFKVSLRESATTGATVLFDVSSGTVVSVVGTGSPTGQITPAGNGWYRCTMFLTQASTANRSFRIFVVADATTTANDSFADRTGDGTSGIYLGGAQLEAGAFPTSYIPTTTAAATRSADVASIDGSNFSSWYNQTEGTVFTEYRDPGVSGTNRTPFAISDGTGSNRIQFFINGITTVNNRHVSSSGGTNNPGNLSAALNSLNRHAIASAVGSCNAASNGTLATASTPATMPVVNRLNIGINAAGTGDFLNAPIARITYWPQALPSQLQALTQ